MAWTGYRKTYDFIPHSQILECLDMLAIADNVKFFGEKHEKVETSCEFKWVGLNVRSSSQMASNSLVKVMRRLVKFDRIHLPNQEIIKEVDENEG